MKPLIVGMVNPYGSDPAYALYYLPRRASGGRLCFDIMGFPETCCADEGGVLYLERFDRVNLCVGEWSLGRARLFANEMKRFQARPTLLLGAKVCQAFRVPFKPFSTVTDTLRLYAVLPHPSGLCRMWSRANILKARNLLRDHGFLIP